MVVAAACHSPSRPSVPTPASVAGTWIGEQTVTSLSGGECLATSLQDVVRLPSQFHATMSQSGTQVTATLDVDHLGAVCSYEGTIDGNALELHATSCTASKQIGLRCADGALRDLVQTSATLRGTVSGSRITGMVAENDEVLESGTARIVAPLVFSGSVILTER